MSKATAPVKAEIPAHLLRSQYWRALIYMFSTHPKLKRYFNTTYFDLQKETVSIAKLRKAAGPWSNGEQFMLKFALHLFNESNKLPTDGLSGMGSLDPYNFAMCLNAMKIRYQNAPMPKED